MKKLFKIRIRIFVVSVLTLFFFVGCSNNITKESDSNYDSAKTVVENYFKYKNDKDKEKLLTTLTEKYNAPNVIWGFDNLNSVKIIDIEEETSEQIRNGYFNNGNGSLNKTEPENLKVFKVNYKIKFKNDSIGPQSSGTYESWYFVIRKDKDSPWLIDDMGQL